MKNFLQRLADPGLLVDREGRIVDSNPALTALLGYTQKDLAGTSVDFLLPRKLRAKHAEHRAAFIQAPSSRAMSAGRRLSAQHRDGAQVPIEVSLTPLGPEVENNVLVLIRGISDRLAAEDRTRLADAAVAATANAVMVTDSLGRIALANEAFTRLTGWRADEVMGETPRFLSSGRHAADFYRELWVTVTEGRVWRNELWNRHRNGTLFVAKETITPLKNAEGLVTHFVAILEDVTARHEAELRTARQLEQLRVLQDVSRLAVRATETPAFALAAAELVRSRLGLSFCTIDLDAKFLGDDDAEDRSERLLQFGDETLGRLIARHDKPLSGETMVLLEAVSGQLAAALHTLKLIDTLRTRASTDALTVLANRGVLIERGNVEVERAQRYGRPLSVILLDIDHFKQANDARGHAFGDEVLRAVGSILMHQRRKSDLAARYGGDELVLLLPETGAADAIALAERVRIALARHAWSIPDVVLTASFGVAELEDRATLAELLAAADQALYQAKREGRDRVVSITLPQIEKVTLRTE